MSGKKRRALRGAPKLLLVCLFVLSLLFCMMPGSGAVPTESALATVSFQFDYSFGYDTAYTFWQDTFITDPASVIVVPCCYDGRLGDLEKAFTVTPWDYGMSVKSECAGMFETEGGSYLRLNITVAPGENGPELLPLHLELRLVPDTHLYNKEGTFDYVLREATCGEDGILASPCIRFASGSGSTVTSNPCSHIRQTPIPATGLHSLQAVPAREPSLTECGSIACEYCALCGCFYSAGGERLSEEERSVPALGDIDKSGTADLKDVSLLFRSWSGLSESGADLNGDGVFDLRDAALLYRAVGG